MSRRGKVGRVKRLVMCNDEVYGKKQMEISVSSQGTYVATNIHIDREKQGWGDL